jgi:hypothetical protein
VASCGQRMRTAAREVRDPTGQVFATGPAGKSQRGSGGHCRELKRGPAAGNRHGGAPRGAVPVATGWPRVANAASRLASVIENQCAPRGAPPPPSFGVGTRRQDDPRAERRAETGDDGKMEEADDDLTTKRVRIGRMPNGRRAWPHQSTTVILRCERKRASKDERPVACGGLRAVALRGLRFARAPQGDGHSKLRAA